MNKTKLNKLLHITLIGTLKYIPMVIVLVYMINMISEVLCLNMVRTQNILGLSVYSWAFMYVASLVFRFCYSHRVFLQYIMMVDVFNFLTHYEIRNTITYYNIKYIFILIGILLFINLILYKNDKNNKETLT